MADPKRLKSDILSDSALVPEEFMRWLALNDVQHQKLRYGTSDIGRTMFANSPILPGECYASIPLRMVLTCEAALKSPMGRAAASLNLPGKPVVIPDRVILYLFMISQRNNPAGYWGPYLRSLPTTYNDPLWWSSRALEHLRGTNLAATVPHHRAMLTDSYQACFPALSDLFPEHFPPSTFTWHAFLWAHSSFASRCFPASMGGVPRLPSSPASALPEPSAPTASAHTRFSSQESLLSYRELLSVPGCLLPFLDSINHRFGVRVTWLTEATPAPALDPQPAADAAATTTTAHTLELRALDGYAEEVGGCVSFQSDQLVPAEAEVFNNYGPKSNEHLLLAYGFVLPDNPADSFGVAIQVTPPAARAVLRVMLLPWPLPFGASSASPV
jgi:hypothetical protein